VICTLCWNMRPWANYAAIAYSHKTDIPIYTSLYQGAPKWRKETVLLRTALQWVKLIAIYQLVYGLTGFQRMCSGEENTFKNSNSKVEHTDQPVYAVLTAKGHVTSVTYQGWEYWQHVGYSTYIYITMDQMMSSHSSLSMRFVNNSFCDNLRAVAICSRSRIWDKVPEGAL